MSLPWRRLLRRRRRASGPPERGLFTYDYKVANGELHINAGQMPTLADQAKLVTIKGKGIRHVSVKTALQLVRDAAPA